MSLVLTRQRDESVMIGDEIEITVVDIRGDKVRLGTTALATRYAIFRKELFDEVVAQVRSGKQKYEPRVKHNGGMLVLSRLRDEQILVVDVGEFELLARNPQHKTAVIARVIPIDIRGDKIRLAFDVNPQLAVHRKEVYDAIRRESRAALQVRPRNGHRDLIPARNPAGMTATGL